MTNNFTTVSEMPQIRSRQGINTRDARRMISRDCISTAPVGMTLRLADSSPKTRLGLRVVMLIFTAMSETNR
jgi:hypothetical protein